MRHRAVESKHGRVSRCARIGDFVPETKLGGCLSPSMGVWFQTSGATWTRSQRACSVRGSSCLLAASLRHRH